MLFAPLEGTTKKKKKERAYSNVLSLKEHSKFALLLLQLAT